MIKVKESKNCADIFYIILCLTIGLAEVVMGSLGQSDGTALCPKVYFILMGVCHLCETIQKSFLTSSSLGFELLKMYLFFGYLIGQIFGFLTYFLKFLSSVPVFTEPAKGVFLFFLITNCGSFMKSSLKTK